MSEHRTSGEIPIAYEVDGPDGAPVIMMLNGLGMQLTQWPQSMLEAFHDAGFRTVRVDNRDVGLSGRVTGGKIPNPWVQIGLGLFGLSAGAPYSLADMADDAASVLDDMGIEKAHVLGLSMGGIISQMFAARYPQRTETLTLFMTTTGNRSLPLPSGEARKILMGRDPEPASIDEVVDRMVAKWQFFMTADGGMSLEELRAFHRAAAERGMDQEGWQRQMAAILETGDLRKHSRTIKAPTLVIHGTEDKLVPTAAGKDVHANIEGSRLELIEGMGHDLPPRLHGRLSDLVLSHLKGDRSQAAA
ncbi:alpha/beta fold hydrolase [Parvularcula lutaonensis]|uniref:Alpha/beta fold hydrolase n=1 Tax=Parvularcula lutaonensis TaxID=491923 RepID=A0ABV7MAN9_9PROT|nr:alpha/beta hydrolase [Parvularcula lutaonensis]GGY38055.1 hydrolase [Parvularcula lutaonensis]